VDTRGVSADAQPGLIEKAFNAHGRTDEATGDKVMVRANWRVDTAGGGETIEMAVRRDSGLASIEIKYRRRTP